VEKYQFKKHKEKQCILQELDLVDTIDRIAGIRTGNLTQLPDLLIYKPDYSDWGLVEVKGEGDRLQKYQKEKFVRIERATGKAVNILRFYNRDSGIDAV
jgi:hypothetical protein